MNNFKKIQKEILFEGYVGDWFDLDLSTVINIVKFFSQPSSENELMKNTIHTISKLVRTNLLVIGKDCLDYFEEFKGSLEEQLEKISKDWKKLNREVLAWEISAFKLTKKGEEEAKKIIDYYREVGSPSFEYSDTLSLWNKKENKENFFHKNGDITIFKDCEKKYIDFDASGYKWNKKRNVWQRIDEKGRLWSWSKEEEDWLEDDIIDEKPQWDEKQKKWFFPSTRKLQQRRRSILGKLDRKIKTKLDNPW